MTPEQRAAHFRPLELPCGAVLKNRLVKSAMSDSLGDGEGNPTDAQIRLYERWAAGGVAASIVGEVQGTPRFAEKPGNLVLHADSERTRFEALAAREDRPTARVIWLQLGHAGAMAHPPISEPKGPSAIRLPELELRGADARGGARAAIRSSRGRRVSPKRWVSAACRFTRHTASYSYCVMFVELSLERLQQQGDNAPASWRSSAPASSASWPPSQARDAASASGEPRGVKPSDNSGADGRDGILSRRMAQSLSTLNA